MTRGFAGPDFFERIRRRPSAPLRALLARRLRRFDRRRLERRSSRGRRLASLLNGAMPGDRAFDHTHWVVPVLVDDPRAAIRRLRRAGFDATQGGSLCVVEPPPIEAAAAMRRMLFLPWSADVPVARMARALRLKGEMEF